MNTNNNDDRKRDTFTKSLKKCKTKKEKRSTSIIFNKHLNTSGEDNTAVYVQELTPMLTKKEVREFFNGCGTITNIEFPLLDDGGSSGTGEFLVL